MESKFTSRNNPTASVSQRTKKRRRRRDRDLLLKCRDIRPMPLPTFKLQPRDISDDEDYSSDIPESTKSFDDQEIRDENSSTGGGLAENNEVELESEHSLLSNKSDSTVGNGIAEEGDSGSDGSVSGPASPRTQEFYDVNMTCSSNSESDGSYPRVVEGSSRNQSSRETPSPNSRGHEIYDNDINLDEVTFPPVQDDSDDTDNDVSGNQSPLDEIFTPAEGVLHDGNNSSQKFAELEDTLCSCSGTTQGEVLVMVLTLGLRHNLSYNAMVDILKMVNVMYGRDVIPATQYKMLKFSEPDRSGDLYHICCPECLTYIVAVKDENLGCEIKCDCGWVIDRARNATSFFMTLGMKSQIKKLLESDDTPQHLSYRFTRKKENPDGLEDIYDGAMYRKLSVPGMPLSNIDNISYCMNLDGIAYGKDSHQQIWPLFITVNEFSPKLRVKNMLMIGIWVGKSEPNMEVFLEPFVQEANELSSKGVEWQYKGQRKCSRVLPLCCVVDTQARWRMLNHTSFHGYFGCTFCEHKGDYVHQYGMRYGMQENVPDDRTDASIRECILKAFDRRHLPAKRQSVKGCKGPCALMNLDFFDLASSMTPDILHYCKGVVEQHLNHILAKLTDDEIIEISKRLLSISTPTAISRTPRVLKEREKFKASEWRSFLVLYGPVVMHGIVRSKYVAHFSMLSCALHILLQKSINLNQIRFCQELIVNYSILYEEYFGLQSMTYNVHLLLHVVDAVLNHGPIWTHTCFPFEGKNRFILQLAMSPFKVVKVIARKYHLFNNLPNLCDKFCVSPDVLQYCSGLFHSRHLWMVTGYGQTVALGSGKVYQLSEEEKGAVSALGLFDVTSGLQFKQISIRGVRFTCDSYGRSKKKNDSGAYLKDGTKCKIKNIVQVTVRRCDKLIVFANEMIESNEVLWQVGGMKMRHIKRVVRAGTLLALNPSDIQGQCLFMLKENETFATCLPYGCIGD